MFSQACISHSVYLWEGYIIACTWAGRCVTQYALGRDRRGCGQRARRGCVDRGSGCRCTLPPPLDGHQSVWYISYKNSCIVIKTLRKRNATYKSWDKIISRTYLIVLLFYTWRLFCFAELRRIRCCCRHVGFNADLPLRFGSGAHHKHEVWR